MQGRPGGMKTSKSTKTNIYWKKVESRLPNREEEEAEPGEKRAFQRQTGCGLIWGSP